MRLIENISDETSQRHSILFQETEIILTLKYSPTVEMWSADVSYKNFNIYGFALTCGVLHMESSNTPFGFAIQDTSGLGLDPFRRDDFLTGRTAMYLIEPDEMTDIRGIEVPL